LEAFAEQILFFVESFRN